MYLFPLRRRSPRKTRLVALRGRARRRSCCPPPRTVESLEHVPVLPLKKAPLENVLVCSLAEEPLAVVIVSPPKVESLVNGLVSPQPEEPPKNVLARPQTEKTLLENVLVPSLENVFAAKLPGDFRRDKERRSPRRAYCCLLYHIAPRSIRYIR